MMHEDHNHEGTSESGGEMPYWPPPDWYQLPMDAINQIMTERNGMGETGETYLVGPDKLMRSDSLLDPAHTIKASFANPEKGRVDTEASREALDLLSASASASALEPLVVAMKLFDGQEVHVATEVMEVAKDVLERLQGARDARRGEQS